MSEISDLIRNKSQFKILVIDDKTNMRRTIRNMLRFLGFTEIQEAEDGEAALRKIRSENYDFLICDWSMPRMDGLELLKILREDEQYRDMPFLMITAEIEESTVAESIEAEVDGYILKPFLPKTLEETMVQILTRKLTPSPLETHLRSAQERIRNQEYPQAHAELDQAEETSPRNPKIHYLRGLIYEAEGALDQAIKAYEKARETGPKFIRAHEKLIEIYKKEGRTSQMLTVLKEAVQISPRNADRQTMLGETLLTDGRIQEARKAFNLAINLDPNNPDRKAAIGESYLAHGLAAEAEKAFKASIQTNPNNIHVYNRLGIAFRRQKKFDEAISFYLKALSIDPKEENLLYNLARAYFGAGKKEQALGSLEAAIKLRPNFKEALELLVKVKED